MNLNQVMTELDNLFTQERISEVPQFLEEHIEQARAQGAQDVMLTLYNECIGFYRETGQYDKSVEYGDKAMELLNEMGLDGTMPYATTLLNIANAKRAAGHLQESLELYNKVRPIYVARLKEDDMYFAGLYNNLSLLYQEMGDFAAAKEQLENALEIVSHKENTAFEIAVTQANLANTCIELGQDDEAKARAQEAIRIFEEIGVDDAHYSAALSALGSLYYMDKDYPNALKTMEKGRECVAKYLGTENIQYQRLSENIAIIKEKMGGESLAEPSEAQGTTEVLTEEEKAEPSEEKAPMDDDEIDKILGIDIDNDGWASVIRADKKTDLDDDTKEKDHREEKNDSEEKEESEMPEEEVFNPAESVSTFNISSAFAEIKAAAAQKLQERKKIGKRSEHSAQKEQTPYDEEKAVDAMIAEVMDEIAVEVEEVSEKDKPKEDIQEPEEIVQEAEEIVQEPEELEEIEPEEMEAGPEETEEIEPEEMEAEPEEIVQEPEEVEEIVQEPEEIVQEPEELEETETEPEEVEEIEPEEMEAEPEEIVQEPEEAEEMETEPEEAEEIEPEEMEAEPEKAEEIELEEEEPKENIPDSDGLGEVQSEDAGEDLTPEITGLELCRRYYEEYGKPMIAEKFPEYEGRIAAGLVGKGSDCFGFDDMQSRDHDFGPRFLLWVTKEVYDKIGSALEEAYENLPDTYMGVKRIETFHGKDRAGVMVIEDFYRNTLGADLIGVLTGDSKGLTQVKSWLAMHDYALAAAVNGAVFRDDEGIFTSYRELLKGYYPKAVWYRKIAQACALFSQNGQYNLPRMRKRGQLVAAELAKAECAKQAMKLYYLLNKQYAPHDKWLFKGMPENPYMMLGEEDLQPGDAQAKSVAQLVWEISLMSVDKEHEVQLATAIESLAVIFANELERQNMIGTCNLYLDANTPELIAKSDALLAATMADAPTVTALSLSIAKAEFEAFDKVQNEGGRASCQNNWPTFKVMRMSQYMTWDEDMLLQYLYEFKTNYANGRNMIQEKYARMMASTAPGEYAAFADKLPRISKEKQEIMEQIIGLQVKWMEEFAKEYPKLAGNARTIHTTEDLPYDTSYETYLRGELGTYSDRLIEMYGRYIVEYAKSGKSVTREIMANTIRFYGYKSFEEAEQKETLAQ